MNETATLAEYVSQVTVEDLPDDVVEFAKLLILDNLGCQIAGVELPWAKRIFDTVIALSGTGAATLVGHPGHVAPDAAAFLNGTVGHSNESDDTHLGSPTHPGSVAIPAALAVGEHARTDGRTMLASVVGAYETMIRIGTTAGMRMFGRGHHPPLAVGPFGAAAAAARTLGLDATRTLQAFAIAGSYSGGQMEYTQGGGSVKRLHCGIPAGAGVRATLLAEAGVTGPATILEGRRGILASFAGEFDPDGLVRGLGTDYLIKETAIKMYSCNHVIQPPLDGLAQLLAEQPFAPDDVASIEVQTTNPGNIPHVGAIIEPEDALGAQFSLAFSLAMFMHGLPCQFWDYAQVDLKDPGLLDFAHRVSMRLVEGEKDRFTAGSHMVVTFRDGSVREITVRYARGEPERPIEHTDAMFKFHRLTDPVIGADRANEIVAAVDRLESLTDVRDLGALLATPAGAPDGGAAGHAGAEPTPAAQTPALG